MQQGAVRTTTTYDNNGNPTQVEEGTTTTVNNFDQENRLSSVFVDDAETNVYWYDGDGLRRVMVESSGARRVTFIWDGTDYLGEVES